MNLPDPNRRRAEWGLLLIFVILSLGIVVGGVFYYRQYERHFRAEAGHQLSAIAELKADELAEYRKERLEDASIFFNNAPFSGLVRRFLDHPEDADAQRQIQTWLGKYQAYYEYSRVYLLDVQGAERLAVPDQPEPLPGHLKQDIAAVLRSGRVTFLDFHRDAPGLPIHLEILVPIVDGPDASRSLGVLVLRINPAAFLYAYIQRWPTPSLPAETLLLRRDGNDALCLNQLKFITNTALNLRFSLEHTNSVAVKAVLGQTGIVEARDSFGAPVLAALYAIPDSPWFLVTRMDTAKVYAPLGERLRLTLLIVSLLLISTALGIGVIWRYQRVRFYKERYQMAGALRRSETKFRTLYDFNSDAVMLLDGKNFFDCNPATLTMFGCATREEFCSKHPADVSPPMQPDGTDSRTLADQRIATALEQGINHFEWVHQRVDTGETFSADVLLSAMELDGKRVLQAVVRDITGRKQAEEALLNSRALYLSLMENLPQSIFRKDRAGRFQFVNERFCRDLRRSPEDIVGRTDADLFPPELAEAYRKDDLRVMDTGQVLDQEEKHVGADGRELFVQVLKTPLRDAQGQVIGIQGVFWDITERKRAEEMLRLNQERLLKVVTQTRCILSSGQVEGPEDWRERALHPVSPFRWDFLVQNEEAAQKILPLELAPGEQYDQAWFRNRERADNAQMNWNSGNAFLNDLPFYRNEFHSIDRHGIGHWMQQFVTVRKLAENRWEIFGITTDISDLKRVEAEMRESQALYHSLVNQMPAGIFRKDAKGRYVFVNSTFCRLKEMTPDHFLGKTVLEVESKDVALATKSASHHATIMQSGKPIEDDELYSSADGQTRYYHVVKSPVLDFAGKIVGTQGVLFDITGRKRAEEALKESEVRYQRITEAITDYIFTVRVANGRAAETTHGPGCLAVTGYQAKEFANDPFLWFRMVAAEDRPRVEEQARRILAGEDPPPIEHRIVRKNGSERWVRNTFVPHRDERGTLVSYDGLIQDITGRKQAEEALRESEERFRRLSDATFEAVAIHKSGVLLNANDQYFKMFGYTPDELLGKQVLPLTVAPEVLKDMMKQVESSGFGPYESIGVRKDGTRFPMEIRVREIEQEGQRIRVGALRDITEQKRAEEALRKSEERLRITLETTKIGSWDWDVKKNVWYASPTYFTMLGYEPDSDHVDHEKWLQRIHPDDRAANVAKIQEVLGGASSGYQYEHRIKHADGSYRWHSVIGHAVASDENGKPVRLIGVRMDITERKRADEALRASEAELRAILESTGDGILAVDRDGERVIKTNRRYAELWRIPQSIIDAGDNNALRNFVLNQLADPDAFLKRVHELYGTDTEAVDTLVFKDGRILERHGFTMQLDGVVIGRVWSFRDITERKRQERELIEKSSELERFTYTVSHDLKSPLVTVKTFLGYLEQDLAGSDQERVKQDVGYMHTAADKMGQLLDELLNLARVGRKMNPAERVTFKELAQEAVRLVAGRISTGGAEVQVADAAVVLEGDRARLTEIWQNLVENACKFMGNQPKPRVEIGVERRGSEMVFFVRDNGAGIEPRYQARVFGLFEKLDPKGEGTGMGLALVKRIVEIYKGRIWVESPGLGQGANFLFTLPAAVILNPEQSS